MNKLIFSIILFLFSASISIAIPIPADCQPTTDTYTTDSQCEGTDCGSQEYQVENSC